MNKAKEFNMTWGSQSWDSVDDYGESPNVNTGPKSFYLPANLTKRVIFLGNAPFTFWQHSLWEITRSGKDREVCLKKNRIGNECPLCDKEMWPSMIGYFTVIDMGDVKRDSEGKLTLEGWTSDRGVTYQFGKKLLGAKRGGRDKPGVLKKIARLAERHGGDLTGCVFDIYRSGNKVESCGDEWDFVEKVNPSSIADYLKHNGASDEDVADLTEVNYAEHFMAKSVDDLKAIISGGSAGNTYDQWSQGSNDPSPPDAPWKKW
tara:strand:- start:2022 stop:2804 length:783 start_codon:yes stop_codon:yes gene_type:complete